MNFYAISALVNAATSVSLGLFVFINRPRDRTTLSFSLFTLSIFCWSLPYYFWQIAKTEDAALLWSRLLMAGAIFIPVTVLHFTFQFLGILEKRKRFLTFSYLLFLVFLLLDFTPYFVTHVEPRLGFEFWPVPGPIYHLFLLIWSVYVVYPIVVLSKVYGESSDIKKLQIKYIIAGSIIGFAGGATNYFLWYRIPIPPFANVLASVYVAMVSYAIVRNLFKNVEIVATQLFIIFLWVIIFIRTLLSEVGSKDQLFSGGLLLVTIPIGVFLIRGVMKEVRHREHIEKLYKRIRESNRQLKELMDIKTEFLQIASHQLRTPLTSLRGLLAMQAKGDFVKLGDAEQKELQKRMLGSANQLNNIVNDLLDAMELEGGSLNFKFTKVNVTKLIQETVGVLRPIFDKKGLTIEFQELSVTPKIEADESHLRHVLLNVISNAERYTENGGLEIKLTTEDGKIVMFFTDTGIGIERKDLPKLFGKFVRGKRSALVYTDGSGLGLYISKKIVDEHHGHITLKSRGAGQGTTVRVELPVKQPS